ncbi:MAG TPA: sulfatase-like hydrolase/transferase [Thermoanaerobaculia bacterium]
MTGPRSRFILSLAVFVALASCGRGRIGPGSNQTPVILISIDTLRSDHLPAYGYAGVATPNIDALRADSILYDRAYSHVPLTLPSHTSILTGMLPADNGVRDNVGYRVNASTPMIQELLKKNGYATGASVSAFVLRRETGIARGFDFFSDEVRPTHGEKLIGRVQRDGKETLEAANGWLTSHIDRPFFFFLHLYEPHTPYEPPEPYYSRYPRHYDGEIAYVDAIVGRLLDELKSKGVYDKALIILLSDHGEGLNEHGEDEHGLFLYREDLQVPLMVKLPKQRRAGASVKTPVELTDVFPTILDRTATLAPKTGKRSGQSLLTFLDGKGPSRAIYAETFYPKFHFGWSDLHSLIDGNDHYIRAPQAELYDLAQDPGEKNNRLEQDRRTYVRMRTAIEPFVQQASAPSNIDPEEAAKLAALGYVGSTVAVKSGESLPDPKGKIGQYNDIRIAYTFYKNKKSAEALQLTERLLNDNPLLTDMWDLKSKILFQMGRPLDSIAAAKDGLRHVPTSIALLYDVANLAMALGDLDTAKQHADIAVKIEPGEAHEILARIALKRGDEKTAEREANAALVTSHAPTEALKILGALAKERGNLPQALAYLDRASSEAELNEKQVIGIHQLRGDTLARMDRNAEAEKEFRAAIAEDPTVPEPYAALIMLLAVEHRLDEATKLIFEVVQEAPEPKTYELVAETLTAIGDSRGAVYWASLGQQRFPRDAELRVLPQRLRDAAPMLRKRMLN